MAEWVDGHHRLVGAGRIGEWCEQCTVPWPCPPVRGEEGELRPWIYDGELHGSVTSYSDRVVLDMVFNYPI